MNQTAFGLFCRIAATSARSTFSSRISVLIGAQALDEILQPETVEIKRGGGLSCRIGGHSSSPENAFCVGQFLARTVD
ncbi:hypothetical protein LZK73_14050 [Neorhizobium galegae]|nr:hypothetical protein LZK73_14050 [Neorhizobium galegae]